MLSIVVIVATICACEKTHEVSEFDNTYVGRLNDDCYADVHLRAHVTTGKFLLTFRRVATSMER